MSRINRYIIAEILEVFLAVTSALILVMSSFHLTKLLSEAAAGKLVGSAIFKLLGLETLNYFVLLAPFAFFIALLIGLGKLASYHELIALQSIGYGRMQLNGGILLLAAPLAALLLYLNLTVLPKSLAFSYQLNDKAHNEAEISALSPGQFRNIGSQAAIYVSQINKTNDFSRFFIWQAGEDQQGKTQSITVAQAGRQFFADGERKIELLQGARFSETAVSSHFVQFEKLVASLPEAKTSSPRERIKGVSTEQLLSSDDLLAKAEWQRRISGGLSIFLLSLLAPLLITFNPRENRYDKFVGAILIYVIYLCSQYILQHWVEQGKLGVFPGVYLAHLLFLAWILWRLWQALYRRI